MSVTVPSAFTSVNVLRFFSGRDIREVDLRTLNANANFHYANAGARCPLMLVGTPWETTSTTFTQTNGGSGPDLDAYQGVLRCVRPLVVSSDKYELTLRVMVKNLEVRVRIFDVSTNTDLGTIDAGDSSGDVAIAEATLALSQSEAESGGEPKVLLASIVGAKDIGKAAGLDAELYAVEVLESIASASQMPSV